MDFLSAISDLAEVDLVSAQRELDQVATDLPAWRAEKRLVVQPVRLYFRKLESQQQAGR